MQGFHIKVDIDGCVRDLKNVVKEQLPFVTAKSLTEIAKKSQENIRASMNYSFNLHSNWVQNGVRIEPAKKSDMKYGTCAAVVKHIDLYMVKHEDGGIKTLMSNGVESSKLPAVPVSGQMRTVRGAVRKTFSTQLSVLSGSVPRALPGKSKAFEVRQRNGTVLVAARGKRERRKFDVLFILRRNMKVKPRLEFETITKNTVDRNFKRMFEQNYEAAISTQ